MTGSGRLHVYGPVPSRRLGRSLGVDLVPFKTCSYDCIYCQLGRTTNRTIERKEYVPMGEVLEELTRKLAIEPGPDFIGLAGSGEPTLHSRLGELIAAIKRTTSTPVAVLTNGSLLWMPDVRDDLMEADLVLPSLDAGDENLFRSINRPDENIAFAAMVDGIADFTRQFHGEVWLEVFLLARKTGVPSEAGKIADLARRIAPSRVQLNTIHRPPAEDFALGVSMARMRELEKLFSGRVEIIGESERDVVHAPVPPNVQDEEFLALLGRRPCSARDLSIGLGIHVNEALKRLDLLMAAGKAGTLVTGGQTFYTAASERVPPPRADDTGRYHDSCQTKFWQEVFRVETDYLSKQLEGARDVLSVGCGPAVVEKGLSDLGFHLTGLDVSREALDRAPDGIRTVAAPAENMPLPTASFDAVIFVVSLQFIGDYRKALEEASRVLRPDGKLVVMLLNPESEFFKNRFRDPGSYVSRIKHTALKDMKDAISQDYDIRTEYLLEVKGETIHRSAKAKEAALVVIRGRKRGRRRLIRPRRT
jgi:wyosine [tRNA(Phe)-imidazoG37] synthetase (radical SAM superfamily)/SAM-dependent methyltransferase